MKFINLNDGDIFNRILPRGGESISEYEKHGTSATSIQTEKTYEFNYDQEVIKKDRSVSSILLDRV